MRGPLQAHKDGEQAAAAADLEDPPGRRKDPGQYLEDRLLVAFG